MQLMLPERSKPDGRLVIDQGQLAGRAYRVEAKVCGNPVCECKEFTLRCFPETPRETAPAQAPLILELDLERRLLVKPALGEATPASDLAAAFMDEINSDQWRYLWTFFYTLKVYYTEHAKQDQLDTHFPPDASEGGMVGYFEILPFARPISFVAEAGEWAFDDQYCLRPDCSCRAAVLQCFRIAPQNADATPERPSLVVRYHYDTQRVEEVEKPGAGLSPKTFLDSMRHVQPGFDDFLSKRHAQLRHLYRLFLKRHRGAIQRSRDGDANAPAGLSEPFRVAEKPGRNDPCPCGSGKKYKKCCGVN